MPEATEKIQIIRASFSADQARERLSRNILFRRRYPDTVELLYLPFYIFEMRLEPELKEYGAVDGIHGTFLYFDPSTLTADEPARPLELPPPVLSQEEARERAISEYRRALLFAGMRRGGRAWQIRSVQPYGFYYLPYWVGYFSRKRFVQLAIIDGLAGEPQGPKIRRAILDIIHNHSM